MVKEWWQNGRSQADANTIGPMPFSADPGWVMTGSNDSNGNALSSTMAAILLGFCRSLVWMGMPETAIALAPAKQVPRYMGFMGQIQDYLDEIGSFVEAIHNEYQMIPDNASREITRRQVCYNTNAWNLKHGMSVKPIYPLWFRDRCELFSWYEQCDESNATHIMLKHKTDGRVVGIEKYDSKKHHKLKLDDLSSPHNGHNLYQKKEFDLNDPTVYNLFGLTAKPNPSQMKILTSGQEDENFWVP